MLVDGTLVEHRSATDTYQALPELAARPQSQSILHVTTLPINLLTLLEGVT
jgi:hypothetical protein